MLSITIHIAGHGHRRFSGTEAELDAQAWAIEARNGPRDLDDEELQQRLEQMTSTSTAKRVLAYLKNAGGRADSNQIAAGCNITAQTACRILRAFAALGAVVDYGQKNRHAPKVWGVA